MAKRIIWTESADKAFIRILEFYVEQNGSKTYSRKLNKEVQALLSVISKQPLIGIKTEKVGFRVLIRSNYKIFYEIVETKIIIHLIWDCRQNPEDIKL
ncbi:MAG TPA: type II toxin-antitoxin system RelE/ParE family toxin [Prolixibacteraceae bacterium]|nr:type II toxin-antitoxin system RelE/ParE family toxin [Prolixibacteraceae bacterium]